MPKYAIVVEDAEKANQFELNRYTEAFTRNGTNETLAKKLAKDNAPVREVGFVHTEAEDECPLGLPNCRNCGDPEFLESCQAAGHCPDCGTKHGIAPDSVVAKNGFKLEAL